MMALPGDQVLVVTSNLFGANKVPAAGLLVARVPADDLYEDDEHDRCSVLFPGRMTLSRFRANAVRPRIERSE